jgi:hypothetical protein
MSCLEDIILKKRPKKQLYSLKIELFARKCKYFIILLLDKLVSRQDLYWTIKLDAGKNDKTRKYVTKT